MNPQTGAGRFDGDGRQLRPELDPDVFGEELEKPAYREAERIAAVGATLVRPRVGADPSPA